jgi:hypothetical protein
MANSVMVGVRAVGPPTWGLVDSLLNLRTPSTGVLPWRRSEMLAPALAGNAIGAAFMDTGIPWLLVVDRDAGLHPDTLGRLLSWGKPLVGALCFTTAKPVVPTVYLGDTPDGKSNIRVLDVLRWLREHPELHVQGPAIVEEPGTSLFPVDWTGCHCLLVHRSVLESVPEPWFEADPALPGGRGEDRTFFRKAAEAGIQAYVDFSVIAAHGDEHPIGALDFLAWAAFAGWDKALDELTEEV